MLGLAHSNSSSPLRQQHVTETTSPAVSSDGRRFVSEEDNSVLKQGLQGWYAVLRGTGAHNQFITVWAVFIRSQLTLCLFTTLQQCMKWSSVLCVCAGIQRMQSLDFSKAGHIVSSEKVLIHYLQDRWEHLHTTSQLTHSSIHHGQIPLSIERDRQRHKRCYNKTISGWSQTNTLFTFLQCTNDFLSFLSELLGFLLCIFNSWIICVCLCTDKLLYINLNKLIWSLPLCSVSVVALCQWPPEGSHR